MIIRRPSFRRSLSLGLLFGLPFLGASESARSAETAVTNKVDSVRKEEDKAKVAPSEKSKPSVTTPEVVVSATRFPEEPWKSGSSITVVPADTVEFRRPFQTAEVLRGEPGIDVSVEVNNGTGAQGGVSQIAIRGMPFSRTLVEVDGLRFNRPLDGIANLSDIPPLLTGNIEVLRGAQSSLYGSEAQGGVVVLSAPRGKGDPTFGAAFEGGTFDTRRERVFTQGEQKEFDWNFEFSRLDTAQERPNNTLRQDAVATRVGYDFQDNARFDTVFRWTDYTVGAPGPIQGFGAHDPDNRLIRRAAIVAPSFAIQPADFWDSKLTLGYIGVGQRFDSPPSQFVNHSQSWQSEWENILRVTDWNTLVAGVEMRSERTTTEASSGENIFNRDILAGYLVESFRYENLWGLTVSGRYDDNDGFRNAFTYRASQFIRIPTEEIKVLDKARLPKPETRIHMSFGTAFRAPTISELEPLFGPFSGANSNLTPETTESYDVGITGGLFDGLLEGDVTYFYNEIKNLIGTDASFTFQNLSKARTEGVEASGKWLVSEQLSFRQTFTLTSTTNKDPRFSGMNLARTPAYSASWTTIWSPCEKSKISGIYNYAGPSFNNATNTQKLSEWHRVDLFAEYQYNKWVTLFGRGENLIGYRYQQAFAFPAVGRAFYAGIEVNF
jgi:vitamin B12 transporter